MTTRRTTPKDTTTWRAVVREYVESILIAVVLATAIRVFIVQPFKIPTGSMRTTLIEGDRILVNKFIYRFTDPKRGDVVVFHFPHMPKKDYIKRCVGLPGDTVEIVQGRLRINGEMLASPEIFERLYYYNRGDYGQEGKALVVPEEQYVMLGDNSASSQDSRYWGFVPRRSIIGKAMVVFWPVRRIGLIR
jgi:signal peptidase I